MHDDHAPITEDEKRTALQTKKDLPGIPGNPYSRRETRKDSERRILQKQSYEHHTHIHKSKIAVTTVSLEEV